MNQVSWGLLILRLVGGTLLIFHGVPALVAGPENWLNMGHTAECVGLHQFYLQAGLCIALAEVLGAVLLLLGVFLRAGAGVVFLTSLLSVAIQLKLGHGLNAATTPLLLSAIFLCLLITGPGHFRLFLK